jgi:hypothetical protein
MMSARIHQNDSTNENYHTEYEHQKVKSNPVILAQFISPHSLPWQLENCLIRHLVALVALVAGNY